MLKKLICGMLMPVCIAIFSAHPVTADAEARAEIVMEVSTGRVLEQNNAEEKLPMASTTKIMTAIIIIEDCNLDDVIIVPDEAVGVEGSSVYLKHGEEISIKDLLYGMMLRSGNDCAAALAVYHSGDIDKFSAEMNGRAEKIGAHSTHFCNPNGLPDDNHYTTAKDLCLISCYAMKNSVFKKIVGTTNYVGEYRSYSNKNKMLYTYEGATGVKTGYTVKAGRCLVSSADRNGFEAVCVVLNCPDMYERSRSLLDNCFESFYMAEISEKNIFMCGTVPCKISESRKVLLKRNSFLRYEVEDNKDTDNKKNNYKGILRVYDEKDLIFEEKLYSINYEK